MLDKIEIVIFSLLTLNAIILAFEDFKSRLISIKYIIVFGLLEIMLVANQGFSLVDITMNFAISALLFMVVKLFLRIKNGKNTKVVNETIGLGDFIIVLLIATGINTFLFLLFLNTSFVIGLLVSALTKEIEGKRYVPLGGIMALVNVVALIIQVSLPEFNILNLS